jgi:hypothetical protein
MCGEVAVKLHTFLTSVLSSQLHTPVTLFLAPEPSGCSNKEKNLCPCLESNSGHPAPSIVMHLLYWICKNNNNEVENNYTGTVTEKMQSLLCFMLSKISVIKQVKFLCLWCNKMLLDKWLESADTKKVPWFRFPLIF